MHKHNICGAHKGMENQYRMYTHGSTSKYSDTLHTESEVYDINYREKRRDV